MEGSFCRSCGAALGPGLTDSHTATVQESPPRRAPEPGPATAGSPSVYEEATAAQSGQRRASTSEPSWDNGRSSVPAPASPPMPWPVRLTDLHSRAPGATPGVDPVVVAITLGIMLLVLAVAAATIILVSNQTAHAPPAPSTGQP